MVSIAMHTHKHQQIDAARTLCIELDETNKHRCWLAFAAIFPEHAKTLRERHAAEDAAAAAAHQRRRFLRAGAVIFLVLLAGAAAYQYRARITALSDSRPTATPSQPAPPPGAPTIPANWQAWQAGYMNRAYQLAAYCWVTVWLLVCLPIVALLAIPAISILARFQRQRLSVWYRARQGIRGGIPRLGYACGLACCSLPSPPSRCSRFMGATPCRNPSAPGFASFAPQYGLPSSP